MDKEKSDMTREELFDCADAVMQGFAIWYDKDAPKARLSIIYLDKPEYTAEMEKKWSHFEVKSSNMPKDILYEMKFIVERNEELLMQEWKESKIVHKHSSLQNNMNLYDLIEQIAEILPVDSEYFYDYVIYTMDDNGGFLRTRYCRSSKALRNIYLGYKKCKKVIVAMNKPIDPPKRDPDNPLKIQIEYGNPDAVFEDAEWDAGMGYNYVYLVDLQNKSFEMKYMECPV